MFSASIITILLVEADLSLVLLLALERFVHLRDRPLAGLIAVQEATRAVLLHNLSANEARQFAEAVRAVDNRVAMATLSVSQQKVAVCKKKRANDFNYNNRERREVVRL